MSIHMPFGHMILAVRCRLLIYIFRYLRGWNDTCCLARCAFDIGLPTQLTKDRPVFFVLLVNIVVRVTVPVGSWLDFFQTLCGKLRARNTRTRYVNVPSNVQIPNAQILLSLHSRCSEILQLQMLKFQMLKFQMLKFQMPINQILSNSKSSKLPQISTCEMLICECQCCAAVCGAWRSAASIQGCGRPILHRFSCPARACWWSAARCGRVLPDPVAEAAWRPHR